MLTSALLTQLNCLINHWGPAETFELKINTDSRTFKAGETFVALSGENFDGFSYVEQVLKIGAMAIVYSSRTGRAEQVLHLRTQFPQVHFIEADDSLRFLQNLASVYIQEWRKKKTDRKIIGITGSNGKTTHKEMCFSLLNAIFPGKVIATKGNLNNHIGVPLTIFTITDDHEIAIIEMGMNHPGEIAELCAITHPEHGMITNIGPAHIEFMKTIENIFLEKSSLYQAVIKNARGQGAFVANGDDEWLSRLAPSQGLTFYGEKNGDLKIKIQGQQISFNFLGKEVLITNENILEHHNLKNLAGVTMLALKLFADRAEQIIEAACRYQQPKMNRSQWIDHIFLDAYNANPSSMKVSIDSFVAVMKNKKISLDQCYFVIGDMNELGEHARDLHKSIAEHLVSAGIQNVTFIGRFKDFYLTGLPHPKSSHEKKEEFYQEWKDVRKNYKYIFIKASRSLQLETLLSIV